MINEIQTMEKKVLVDVSSGEIVQSEKIHSNSGHFFRLLHQEDRNKYCQNQHYFPVSGNWGTGQKERSATLEKAGLREEVITVPAKKVKRFYGFVLIEL